MSKKKQTKKKTAKKTEAAQKKPAKGIIIAAVALLLAAATAVAVFLVKKGEGSGTPTTEPVVTVDNNGSQYSYAEYKGTKMPVEFVEILNQAELDRAEMCEKYGVALEIGDREISLPEFVMYYYDAYYLQTESVNYSIEQTGQNRTGYDLSLLPDEQQHPTEDYTWAEKFTLDVIDNMTNNYSIFDMAVEAGTELDSFSISEVFGTCDMVDERAEKDKITPEEVMANTYCEGLTPAIYKAREIMVAYAQAYENNKYGELYNGYSEFEVEKAYEESDGSYDVARLRVYPIEGEYNEAEALAVSNEKEFLAYAQKNYPRDNYDAEFATECGYITKEKVSSVYGEEVGEWAFAEGRKKGDIALVEGMLFRYLVYVDTPAFLSTSCNIMTVTAAYEDYMTEEERAEIYKQKEEEYLKWKNGEATKESFLAYSDNAGGAGEETVRIGDYYFEFDNWIHNPERKSGDSAIIDSAAGVCIVYYVGKNADDYDWNDKVRDELALEDIRELYADVQSSDYKAKRKAAVIDKAYDEAGKSIKRHWARLEEKEKKNS